MQRRSWATRAALLGATLALALTIAACGASDANDTLGTNDDDTTDTGAGSDTGTGSDGPAGEAAADGISGTVLVFAAASLTDAFADIESTFEDTYREVDVQLNLAGSSALREQILAGAPADVFASAAERHMDELVDAGEVAGTPEVFAVNRMRIAVPAGNPGGVTGLGDLAKADLLIGFCAEGVPCGDLARELLATAGVEPSLDTNEPDVRSLLTKIAVGELDAGLVYVTDVAVADDQVEGIDLPAELDLGTAYPIAILTNAPNPEAANAFTAFVRSETGQAILANYGFGEP